MSKDEEKTKHEVWLVRHGQSEFNEKMDSYFEGNAAEKRSLEEDIAAWWERADHYDPFTMDAKLTQKGVKQATDVGNKIKDLKLDLFVVSPLQRALQTFEYIMKIRGREKTNVIVHPLASERGNSSCDVGSSISTLRKEFPSVDFSSLKEGKNWHALTQSPYKGSFCVVPNISPPKVMEPLDEFGKRIDSFKSWLRSRPERRICVVCHAVVIHEFTGTWVENCSVTKVEL